MKPSHKRSPDQYMKTIYTTDELAEYCKAARNHPYVTIDTEFLRERTYYSKLCLIQMAYPGIGDDGAVLVDVLSGKMELDPLLELFKDESVVKVFHAARQDLEIFFSMAKGFFRNHSLTPKSRRWSADLASRLAMKRWCARLPKKTWIKSSRFTDWSQRPLSERQQLYALADVTHLRAIYEFLAAEIKKTGRVKWVEEELEILTDPATYIITPDMAWTRVKTRTTSGKFLAVVRELARFREDFAQSRNVPRSRVYKDDAMLELASTKPKTHSDLAKSRLLMRDARKGEIADGILAAIEAGTNCPPSDYPVGTPAHERAPGSEGLADLLRVLLKAKAEEAGVAQKLIANASDLDDIAAGIVDGPAMRGWRRNVFGEDALNLCAGKIALSANGRSVKLIQI